MRLSKEAFEHRRDMNIKFIDTPVSEISYNMGFDEGYAFARKEMEAEIQRLNDLLWKYQEPGKLTIKEFE